MRRYKEVFYQVPDAPLAWEFGHEKTGCYVVRVFDRATPPGEFASYKFISECAFAEKQAALAHARSLGEPFSPWSSLA